MNKKWKTYAPVVLRVGLSIVFLWFGITQVINPESFLGYIPEWLYPHESSMIHEHPLRMMHNIPSIPTHTLIMGNGFLEIIFGGLLLIGLWTRISAIVLTFHLMGIIIGLGYNDIAVRDFGLMAGTITVALYGPDKFCLDKKLRRSNNK